MAERPYVAGAVAIGIVAAALHLGSAPAPLAPPSSPSSGGAHIRRPVQHPETGFDKVPWAAEMKDHPEYLGKLTAQKEFDDTINDFYTPPTAAASALEVMIAIEPDPVHTHLSLLFDRDIDALEDAMQAAGYLYQSNWLPWSTPSSGPSTADRFTDQEEQHLFLEGRESYPGVILFRPRSASQNPPLAVFVVGNSPTGGINRTQFEEAISQLKLRAHLQTHLRILGPTFSGSGPSLRTLLSEETVANSGLAEITIASGSVTDSLCSDFLPHDPIDANGQCVSKGEPRITFVSFGIDKAWRNDQIGAFLVKQGGFKPEEIAELTEDESSYGLNSEDRSGNDNEKKYLYLHFPRNISHLRTAYQNSNIFGFGVSAPGAGNVSLSLDLNETSDEDDAIPDFAQQQMPVSQDGIMREITQILEQHQIKVVMLSATDVLDELFVAEILAREAPNALIVIKQADNLFLRSTSPNDFTNMYFVSPFPLINSGGLGKFIFPSDISEGLYIAVLYLYPPRNRVSNIPGYGSPGSRINRPALWLSMVGHGAYWPVALLEDPDSTRRSGFHLPPLANKVPSTGGQLIDLPHLSVNLILLLLCLIALYHTAKAFNLRAIKDFSFRYAINDKDTRAPKLFLQLGITLLLLAAITLSMSPSYNSPIAKYACYIAAGALCFASAHLICLVINPVCGWLFSGMTKGLTGNKKKLISALTTCVLAGVTGLMWFLSWNQLWYRISSQSLFPDFFNYRASYPLRGVSPVFPLVLTIFGFYVFLYCHLDRIAFTDSLRPRLPAKVDDLPNCPADLDLERMTDLLIWPPKWPTIRNKLALLAVVVALIWTGIKALHLRPRMFDGSSIQKWLGLAMFLLVVAMLWELTMAAIVWHRLKSLCLERLESSSLRRGFSSISGLTWRSLWIFRGSLPSRYRVIQRLLEQTGRGVLYAEARRPNGGTNLEEKVKGLYNALSKDSGLPIITEEFGAVQKQIAALAGRLLGRLKAAWIKENGTITACDANDDKEAQPCVVKTGPSISTEQLVCEEWVALVYVHYIRMVLLQVRSRLVTGSALYVFLIWAATCYPYLNRHVLLIALAALLGLLSFSVILVYASINRDPILSRTTNHTPGHLDLDFYLKTASLVGIPLVGFIASQFPEVSGFLFSWLEPGMAAIK